MNTENIRRVIEGIRAHAVPGLGFNMETFLSDPWDDMEDRSGHDCATTACGAGWTVALIDSREDMERMSCLGALANNQCFVRASVLMDLDFEQAEALFLTHLSGEETPEDFIAACEHLIEHGEVRWPTLEYAGEEGED